LGRAGAARPSPPAPPVAPRGRPPGRQARRRPRTVVAHPARGRQPRGRCSHLAPQPAPVPTAQPPATGAPHASLAWLVAQRASAAAAARTQPGGPGPLPTSLRPTRLRQHRPRPGLLDRRSSRRRPAATGPPPVPVVRSPGHRLSGRRRTRLDGRGRQQTAGRWMVDSRRPTAGPSGRPQVTGHRTAGQPDPGRRYRMGDTACWTPATDAVAWLLAVSTTATTPDLSIPAGRSSGQTPSG
jgi:hypothetical protein